MVILIVFGFFGGAAADILAMHAALRGAKAIARTRRGFGRRLAAACLGGVIGAIVVVAYALSGTQLTAVVAMQLGLSAPLILQALAQSAGKLDTTVGSAVEPGASPAARSVPEWFEHARAHLAISE